MTGAGGSALARVGWGLARLRGLALAALAGAALALAQPPGGRWWLVFLAVPVLARFADRASPRGAFALGWAAGTAFFAVGIRWIAEAFYVDAARHAWMAPFALIGLCGGLALFWGAGFWLFRRIAARGPARAAAFAAALALAEAARAYVLTGFPWALPAYVWSQTPVAQTASLFGPHMLGFLTLLLAAAPAFPPIVGDAGLTPRRLAAAGATALAAAAIVALGWSWGAARLADPEPQAAASSRPLLRIVQPNAPQKDKWRREMIPVFWNRLLALSTPGPDEEAPDIVIWPETATPFRIDQDPDARAMIAEAAAGAIVLTGAQRADLETGRWYNSFQAVTPEGEIAAIYDKAHLVPFGEYVPLWGVLDAIGLTGVVGAQGGFSAGPGPRVIRIDGAPPFAPQICYETIFPHEMPPLSDRPDWIVQATNDAWFGDSAGPRQHFEQARMRAIEQGLPVVRAANTGISGVIDAKGRVTARLGLLRAGALQARLPAPLPPTLYARLGDAPWLALIAAVALLSATTARLRRRDA